MPAPQGNQNAAKPEAERLDDVFRFRCQSSEKAQIEAAATRWKMTAAQWARTTLLKAARTRGKGRSHGV